MRRKKNNLSHIKERQREALQGGYYQLRDFNRGPLLGPSTRKMGDGLLLDILNLEEEGTDVRAVSATMAYLERPRARVKPTLSGLAKIAFEGPVSRVSYVDLAPTIESAESSECLNKRINELHELKHSSALFQLILVNGGVSSEPDDTGAIDRAKSVVNNLRNLPSSTFRVGMVAVPDFVEALGLKPARQAEASQQAARFSPQPVALVG
jgi:hypothetical protein